MIQIKIKQNIYLLFLLTLCFALASCAQQQNWIGSKKARQEVPPQLVAKMHSLGMNVKSPILIRIFKKENSLEIWKQQSNGEFALLTTYNICAWSGKLGPKYIENDRQTPEGFYEISINNMNALSNYYLAINIGFPNKFDAENGRTGRHLMIHGGCSSSGCYAMNDSNIAQIYALARDAFLGGQEFIQIQAYPFRMTARNMALYRSDPNYAFWNNIKLGYDIFELTHSPVLYEIFNRTYVFNDASNHNIIYMYNKVFKPNYDKEYKYYVSHTPKNYKAKNPKLQGIKGASEAAKVAQWMKKVIRTGVESASEPLL